VRIAGRGGKAALGELVRAACAVRASLRHVPTFGGEAESHAEAALLRLIEALIPRFLGTKSKAMRVRQ
jgi:hypothetical protein